MTASSPNTARSRQVALWILRAFAPPRQGRQFFSERGYEDHDIAEYLGLPRWSSTTESRKIRFRMKSQLEKLESTRLPVGLTTRPRRNLDRFSDSLGLDEVDRELLAYFIIHASETVLRDVDRVLSAEIRHDPGRHYARMLNLSPRVVERALSSEGRLRQCRLIDDGGSDTIRGIRISDGSPPVFASRGVAERLLNEPYNETRLLREFGVVSAGKANLSLDSYLHLSSSLGILLRHLCRSVAEGRSGVNILLHGPPGTGKTELTRTIAETLEVPLFEIEMSNKGREPIEPVKRLERLDFANSFLSSRPCLLVFDESEDIFAETLFDRSIASKHKGWFNQMLEHNHWPVLWISNAIGGLDPAFARRFDMVLEIPVPPREERHRIVSRLIGDLADDTIVETIAADPGIAPAVVERSASVFRGLGEMVDDDELSASLSRHIGESLRAQGLPDPFRKPRPSGDSGGYDPGFVNTTHDLNALAYNLQQEPSARICLHGPPGTGKTSFCHWLASELDRPLLARKASDLFGPYVGMTERLIADAFEEAEAENGILLFDEVDSFLADRSRTSHSWEITAVNEMLTGIDSFGGILLASTNRLDALDAASLRRFDLKLEFGYLHGDQVTSLLETHAGRLGLPAPSRDLSRRASEVGRCTPGDFAAVARRHRFDPFPDTRSLLDAVSAEIAGREGAFREIGFASS